MFLKGLFRTMAGAVVGLTMGSLVGGNEFLSSLALAIICTAGLSLLVILPACYLIGLVATIWFVPWGRTAWSYGEKEAQARLEARRVPLQGRSPVDLDSLPRAERAIAAFAMKAFTSGETLANIERRLEQAGWSADLIRRALDAAALPVSSATSTQPPPLPGADPY